MQLRARKVTYRLYPTRRQTEALETSFRLHQRLYNAALQQRRMNYDLLGKSISFPEQCKALTQLRAARPEYKALNAQSAQVTLKRVDLAFRAYFRRAKAGIRPAGFPRFKAFQRFKGWGYKTHGDGWTLRSGARLQHGKIRLSGIGDVQIRGQARTPGAPKTCEIIKKTGRWYASVTVICVSVRVSGLKAQAIDWGVETFATVVDHTEIMTTIDNPRHLELATHKLTHAQRALSRKKSGTKNRAKAKQRVARLHQHVANQRKDFHHQIAARLVKESTLLATEQLDVKEMTKKEDKRRRLHRNILDTGPAQFFALLQSKAEEAGIEYREAPTKTLKPSQTCARCGRQEKKLLSQRAHVCPCGFACGRDENAARVILHWALTGNAPGQELTSCGEQSPARGHTAAS